VRWRLSVLGPERLCACTSFSPPPLLRTPDSAIPSPTADLDPRWVRERRNMPHLMIQTKFSASDASAEVNVYGTVERETMQAVQLATCSALQTPVDLSSSAHAGTWQKHPLAPNVM
jgi:hypothetical protein